MVMNSTAIKNELSRRDKTYAKKETRANKQDAG
jgi:hypothetical protein